MSEETLTIVDNRTGKQITVPIEDGAIRATSLRELTKDDGDGGLGCENAHRPSAGDEIGHPPVGPLLPGAERQLNDRREEHRKRRVQHGRERAARRQEKV